MRIRAIEQINSAHGTFVPGQVFEVDDDVAEAWTDARLAEPAGDETVTAPATDAGDDDAVRIEHACSDRCDGDIHYLETDAVDQLIGEAMRAYAAELEQEGTDDGSDQATDGDGNDAAAGAGEASDGNADEATDGDGNDAAAGAGEAPPDAAGPTPAEKPLSKMNKAELQAIAGEMNLDRDGTNRQLVDRITAARAAAQ